MARDEALVTVLDLVDVFEEMKILYHVGGSLAISVHGVPRQTHDLDLVADLPMAAAPILALADEILTHFSAQKLCRFRA